MNLELHNTMPFGKYKGQTIEAIFKENSGYLVWMRDQRKGDITGSNFFSVEVGALLDMAIRDSGQLQKKYKPWNLPVERVVTAPENRQPEQKVAYNSWGSF